MSKVGKISALLTLVLWGLAAMHCQLEALPGFDFLESCCSDEAPAAQQDDCADDGCGPVEDGKYRPEENIASAPSPIMTVVTLASIITDSDLPRGHLISVMASLSPREVLCLWRFTQRAAPPPRAPSLA